MLAEATSIARGIVFAAALSAADIERLERYSAAAAMESAEAQSLAERARAEFAGRGTDIAEHFLLHTAALPGNNAYFFVLEALGDPDAAVRLIRALPEPPAPRSGLLHRTTGEIAVAIEGMLAHEAVRADPRIIAALEGALAVSRLEGRRHEAVTAVRLIGLCRTARAARALAMLARDRDESIRAAAAEALGEFEARPGTAADPVSPAHELVRLLSSDPNPAVRRDAAVSLGSMDAPESAAGLRAALDAERDPRVVDAVLQSLHRRDAPLDDPDVCRGLIARTWEAHVAGQMLECWLRSGASRAQLQEVALNGTATERAVALYAISTVSPRTRSLVVPPEPQLADLDPALRDRLLEAAVWTLSQPGKISMSTREHAFQAVWNLSERNMKRALDYADRITPAEERILASFSLAAASRDAYDAARRTQHAAVALFTTLVLGVLALIRSRFSRAAVLLAVAAALWTAWTLQASGVRDLPPPPFWFSTVAAIAFAAAGATAAAMALVRRREELRAAVFRTIAVAMGSGVLAAVVCSWTRSARLFPSGTEGWELITDPLAAGILGGASGLVLAVVDRLLPARAS